jgi:hypothetical protein
LNLAGPAGTVPVAAAHNLLGHALSFMGEYAAARDHLELSREVYDRLKNDPLQGRLIKQLLNPA